MKEHRDRVIRLIRKAGFNATDKDGVIGIEMTLQQKDGQLSLVTSPGPETQDCTQSLRAGNLQ
jgi:hypothetical protein